MNHRWTPKGQYGSAAICIKCGMVRATTCAGRLYRSDTFTKTPPCDEVWPENWKPGEMVSPSKQYTMLIGDCFYNFRKNYIAVSTFDDAKKHIRKFGVPLQIITNYYINDESCHALLLWIILKCKHRGTFYFQISDVREHDEETQKTADLAKLFSEYLNMCKEPAYLE